MQFAMSPGVLVVLRQQADTSACPDNRRVVQEPRHLDDGTSYFTAMHRSMQGSYEAKSYPDIR
eukprot:scaffold653852_cov66-Prasinocladus_malaysianus.AAC.1